MKYKLLYKEPQLKLITFKMEIRGIIQLFHSDNSKNGTLVNKTCHSVNLGSLEITPDSHLMQIKEYMFIMYVDLEDWGSGCMYSLGGGAFGAPP